MMRIIYTTIILLILSFKASRTKGADELPSIIDVTNKVVGNYRKMKCLASGDNIKYTWKQFRLDNSTVVIREYDNTSSGDVTVDSDGTISFYTLRWDLHDGYYQCFVSNSKGAAFSRKVKLRIKNVSRFVPSNPVDLKEKDVGDIVTLSCPPLERPRGLNSFRGSFGYSEYWLKHDGIQFSPIDFPKNILHADGKLVFSPLRRKNCDDLFKGSGAGIICHRDAGGQMRRSPGVSLSCSEKQFDMEKKRKKPVWVQTPNKVEVAVEGQTTSLTCISQGVPTPDVTWYFNNETKITSGLNGYKLPTKKYNRNLIIQSVMKAKHEGNYTCRAKSTEGEIISHTHLKVQVRPRFTQQLDKKLTIDMNGYGFLKCEAYAVPRASYSWWKNGQELTENRGKMILELARVNLTSSGVYQCVAENLVGMNVTSTKVEVKTQVPIVKKFGPFFLFHGTTRELPCRTEAIPDVHQFVWFHNGMQMKNNSSRRHILLRSGTLRINDVRETDGGKYRCLAINAIGNGSAEAQAVVYRQTFFKVLPNDTSVEEGGDFYLLCGAIQDKRLQLQYRWQKDGVTLTSKERHIVSVDRKVSKLQVLNARLSDEGVYECVAFTHPHKFEIKAIATVKIKVPSVPVDVNVIPFGKYILLRWGPPSATFGNIKSYSVGISISANQTAFPELRNKVKSNRLEHLFKNLEYTTSYIVGVAAENNAGIGPAVYLNTSTVMKTVPAKPAVPVVNPVSTSSVNVTYEYGHDGGYPVQFTVKYKKSRKAENNKDK